MAAIVLGVRGRKSKGARRLSEDSLEPVTQLPPNAKRKMDVELSTLLNGTWQLRRVVYSTSELFILLVNEESVRDFVPMQDIEAVQLMDSEDKMSKQSPHSDIAMKSGTSSSRRRSSQEKIPNQSHITGQNNRFQVRTTLDGFNSGRTYYFKAQTEELCNAIVQDLQKYSEEMKKQLEVKSRFKESQKAVARIYNSKIFQGISSTVIILNFCICIATAELGLEHMNYKNETVAKDRENVGHSFDNLDFFFVAIFALELAINAYAHWFTRFIQNGWSIFDFIVVFLSILGLAPIGIPLSLLLLLRSCRVLRIFGKLKAVSKIFAALAKSILPMANVFFIIFIVACIYATAGVSFFFDEDQQNFSSFSSAFIAMFNITVGSIDWWFQNFPPVNEDGSFNWLPTVFLISYIVLVVWVFFQVSIAVLLDNFLAANSEIQKQEALELLESRKSSKQFRNPLDPLLLRLAKDYCNEADLSNRINEIFLVRRFPSKHFHLLRIVRLDTILQALDSDDSGDLSSQEFQAAMKKLNGALCNEKGHMGPKEFEKVILEQLRLYSLARLSTTSDLWTATEDEFTIIGSLKQILMEQLKMRKEISEIMARLPPLATQGTAKSDFDRYLQRKDCDSEYSSSASIKLNHENCISKVGSETLHLHTDEMKLCSEALTQAYPKESIDGIPHGHKKSGKLKSDLSQKRGKLKHDPSEHRCLETDLPATQDLCWEKSSISFVSTCAPIPKQISDGLVTHAQGNSIAETPIGAAEEVPRRISPLKPPLKSGSVRDLNGKCSNITKTNCENNAHKALNNGSSSSQSLQITDATSRMSSGAESADFSSCFREPCVSRLSYLDDYALGDALVTAELCCLSEQRTSKEDERGPRVLLL